MAKRARVAGAAAASAVILLAGCGTPPEPPSGLRATETFWCADRDGVVDTVTVDGHDGPVTSVAVEVVDLAAGDVSDEDLLDACAGPWWWRRTATLCEAYADAAAVERFTASEFVAAAHGRVTERRPGFPVVVRGNVDCADLTLQVDEAAAVGASEETAMPERLRGWSSTDAFNAWRGAEQRFREAADGGCLEVAEARDLARLARHDLAGDWPVLDTARDAEHPMHAGLCFDVRLDRGGFVEVRYHAVESPGGLSGDRPSRRARRARHRRPDPRPSCARGQANCTPGLPDIRAGAPSSMRYPAAGSRHIPHTVGPLSGSVISPTVSKP